MHLATKLLLFRHVVHENKVTQKFGVNQFQSKRYPDEDATNPFEGSGGNCNIHKETCSRITSPIVAIPKRLELSI